MKRNAHIFEYSLIILSLLLFSIISYLTYFFADDFYYAVFFRNGLGDFFRKTAEHYMTMNGRALIHFVAEVVLLFKTYLFAVVNPMALLALFYLSAKIQNENSSLSGFSVLIGLLLIIFLPQTIARESLYWITGSMNYLLPILMALATFYIQIRCRIKRNTTILSLILCIICGASTELGGACSCAMTFSYALFNYITDRKSTKPHHSGWLHFIAVFLGYITVVFSPGTFHRAAFEGSFIQGQTSNTFSALAEMLLSKGGVTPYLILVLLLIGFLPMINTSLPKHLHLTAIFAMMLAAGYWCGFIYGIAYIVIFIACMALILASGFFLLKSEDLRPTGAMLISVIAIIAVLIIAPSTYVRTLLPIVLILSCIATHLFVLLIKSLFRDYRKVLLIISSVAFICAIIFILPTVQGYWYNHTIHTQNQYRIENSAENGYAEISVDIIEKYAYNMFYYDGFFINYFNQYYNISDSTPLYYTSQHYPDIYCNGQRLTHPAQTESGSLYIPLSPLLHCIGADIFWSNDSIIITFDQKTIECNDNTLCQQDQEPLDITGEYFYRFGKLYWNSQLLSKIFDLKVHEENGLITIYL